MSERVERVMRDMMPPDPAPTLAYMEHIDLFLRRSYVYAFDHENWLRGYKRDDWSTLIPEMARRHERGDKTRVPGDCDDLALSACDAALWAGFPEEDLRFLLVMSPMGQILHPQHDVDHAIAGVYIDGTLFIIGDTFAPCYPAALCQHKLYAAHRYPLGSNDFYAVSDWSEV